MALYELLEGRRLFSFTYAGSDAALTVNVNGYAKITETAPGTINLSDGCHSVDVTLATGGFLTIQGGRGTDVIVLIASSDDYAVGVDGGNGADILVVTNTGTGTGAFDVSGGNGNDLIVVQGGAVNASGGNGNDVLYVTGDPSHVQWNGGNGIDIGPGSIG